MRLAVYLPLLLPVLAAVFSGPLARRLEPRLATWLLTVAGLVLAASSTAALGLLALAGLVRFPLIEALKGYSPQVIAHQDPATMPAAVAGAVLLTLAAGATARFAVRRMRALWSAALDAACLPGGDPVVVTDDQHADAYTMPGFPGRIVVSHGMLAALGPSGREIVLAHERAHLEHHHYAFVALAQISAAANPLLGPLAESVAFTVERWADENAARDTGDRRAVAETVARAAVATKRSRSGRLPRPGAVLGVLGHRPHIGVVPRRVAALLNPAPHSPAHLLAAAVVVVAVSGIGTLEAIHDLHAFLEFAETR